MNSSDHFKVLDDINIGNSFQARISTVNGPISPEEVFGITCQTPQAITGLSGDDLTRCVAELLVHGFIRQDCSSHPRFVVYWVNVVQPISRRPRTGHS